MDETTEEAEVLETIKLLLMTINEDLNDFDRICLVIYMFIVAMFDIFKVVKLLSSIFQTLEQLWKPTLEIYGLEVL